MNIKVSNYLSRKLLLTPKQIADMEDQFVDLDSGCILSRKQEAIFKAECHQRAKDYLISMGVSV